jgi:hypothetical protein
MDNNGTEQAPMPPDPVFDAAADQAAATIETEEARATVEIDGELYFEDTGEYAGPIKGSGFLPEILESPEHVELFMERLLEAEAMTAAEELRLKAIIANADRILKRKASKVSWLRRVFGPQAEAIILASLPRKKDGELKIKTWTCPYGTIGFTAKQAALKVDKDGETKAIEYAQYNGFDACIKTEQSFLISNLPKDVKASFIEEPIAAAAHGFVVTPSHLQPKIATGIKNASKSDDE